MHKTNSESRVRQDSASREATLDRTRSKMLEGVIADLTESKNKLIQDHERELYRQTRRISELEERLSNKEAELKRVAQPGLKSLLVEEKRKNKEILRGVDTLVGRTVSLFGGMHDLVARLHAGMGKILTALAERRQISLEDFPKAVDSSLPALPSEIDGPALRRLESVESEARELRRRVGLSSFQRVFDRLLTDLGGPPSGGPQILLDLGSAGEKRSQRPRLDPPSPPPEELKIRAPDMSALLPRESRSAAPKLDDSVDLDLDALLPNSSPPNAELKRGHAEALAAKVQLQLESEALELENRLLLERTDAARAEAEALRAKLAELSEIAATRRASRRLVQSELDLLEHTKTQLSLETSQLSFAHSDLKTQKLAGLYAEVQALRRERGSLDLHPDERDLEDFLYRLVKTLARLTSLFLKTCSILSRHMENNPPSLEDETLADTLYQRHAEFISSLTVFRKNKKQTLKSIEECIAKVLDIFARESECQEQLSRSNRN